MAKIWDKKALERKKKARSLNYMEKMTTKNKYNKVVRPFTING